MIIQEHSKNCIWFANNGMVIVEQNDYILNMYSIQNRCKRMRHLVCMSFAYICMHTNEPILDCCMYF